MKNRLFIILLFSMFFSQLGFANEKTFPVRVSFILRDLKGQIFFLQRDKNWLKKTIQLPENSTIKDLKDKLYSMMEHNGRESGMWNNGVMNLQQFFLGAGSELLSDENMNLKSSLPNYTEHVTAVAVINDSDLDPKYRRRLLSELVQDFTSNIMKNDMKEAQLNLQQINNFKVDVSPINIEKVRKMANETYNKKINENQ